MVLCGYVRQDVFVGLYVVCGCVRCSLLLWTPCSRCSDGVVGFACSYNIKWSMSNTCRNHPYFCEYSKWKCKSTRTAQSEHTRYIF